MLLKKDASLAFGRVLLFSPFLCLWRCRFTSSLRVLLGGCRRNEDLWVLSLNVWFWVNIWMVNETIHGITFPNIMPSLENLSLVLTQNGTASGHPLAFQWEHSLQHWEIRCTLLNPGKNLNQEQLLFSHCFKWRRAFPSSLSLELGLHYVK